MPHPPASSLPAWFLGPRGENAELLERLVVEALRDHVFWRRNYHPEDGVVIREMDKRQEGYEETVATLTQELMGLLARLKRDAPFFSGRYKGQPVPAHAKHRDAITPELFDRWLALWGQTARELMTPKAAVALEAKAARIAESLQLALFFRLDPQPVARSA